MYPKSRQAAVLVKLFPKDCNAIHSGSKVDPESVAQRRIKRADLFKAADRSILCCGVPF